MSALMYTHTRQDLEKIVEIVLQKTNSILAKQITTQAPEEEKLITQLEAAKLLQKSVATIIEWRKNKGLPHYNFNGRFFYSPKELLHYGKNMGK